MKTTVEREIDNLIKLDTPTEEIVAYIAAHLTTAEVTEELANALKENRQLRDRIPSMVRISKEDFDSHFRIIGYKSDGTPEQRGSNRWKKEA